MFHCYINKKKCASKNIFADIRPNFTIFKMHTWNGSSVNWETSESTMPPNKMLYLCSNISQGKNSVSIHLSQISYSECLPTVTKIGPHMLEIMSEH